MAAEIAVLALQAGIVEHPQLRSESRCFLLPVENKRSGDYRQCRPQGGAGGPQLAARLQQRQHLRGLAYSHVVSQAASERVALEKEHPAQALALIVPQVSLEIRGLFSGLDPLKLA